MNNDWVNDRLAPDSLGKRTVHQDSSVAVSHEVLPSRTDNLYQDEDVSMCRTIVSSKQHTLS